MRGTRQRFTVQGASEISKRERETEKEGGGHTNTHTHTHTDRGREGGGREGGIKKRENPLYWTLSKVIKSTTKDDMMTVSFLRITLLSVCVSVRVCVCVCVCVSVSLYLTGAS